jgi:hypothetical protein
MNCAKRERVLPHPTVPVFGSVCRDAGVGESGYGGSVVSALGVWWSCYRIRQGERQVLNRLSAEAYLSNFSLPCS